MVLVDVRRTTGARTQCGCARAATSQLLLLSSYGFVFSLVFFFFFQAEDGIRDRDG